MDFVSHIYSNERKAFLIRARAAVPRLLQTWFRQERFVSLSSVTSMQEEQRPTSIRSTFFRDRSVCGSSALRNPVFVRN